MSHPIPTLTEADTQALDHRRIPPPTMLIVFGIVLIGAAFILAALSSDGTEGGTIRRAAHAYLIGYAFVLGITLGSLFFVIITHLFRAGWCVAVRRIPEAYAANMPWLAVLALPLLFFVAADGLQNKTITGMPEDGSRLAISSLYNWNVNFDLHHGHGDHEKHGEDHGDEPKHEDHDGENQDAEHSSAPAMDPQVQTVAHAPGHHVDLAAANDYSDFDADPEGKSALGKHIPEAVTAWAAKREIGEEITYLDQDDAYLAMTGYLTDKKRPWLNWWFFSLRVLVYLGIWSAIGLYYFRHSVAQDKTGGLEHTLKREGWAPPVVILFALTITFGAFDLLMSLDPSWYSTIFGVYYFAGCFLSALSVIVLTIMGLRRLGMMQFVTAEHFHDLGKLMFAFVFFWGYIAFSQFMLIWYASLPETTYWFELRGITTVRNAPQFMGGWTGVSILLLFGKLLLPFLFLLSRHVKRNGKALSAAAVWLIVMQYVDLYWVVMPMYNREAHPPLPLVEIIMVLGLSVVVLGGFISRLRAISLVGHQDPRVYESLGAETAANAPLFAHPESEAAKHSHH